MTTPIDTGTDSGPGARRQYWSDVLDGAGLTTVPRWCTAPGPGVAKHPIAEHTEQLPARLADMLGSPGVLLAAHAVVLAALSGEREITTGYLTAADAEPLPLRLPTDSGSWRAIVTDAAAAEQAMVANLDFPVDALAVQLGRSGPLFEAELDPHGSAGGP
ncbi:MAG: non-ribosomal peptide synthetase, partial [Pseudonocardia sp.]|nr:non-ribosomal peptide synthetase [Pseudonocardia sp.]